MPRWLAIEDKSMSYACSLLFHLSNATFFTSDGQNAVHFGNVRTFPKCTVCTGSRRILRSLRHQTPDQMLEEEGKNLWWPWRSFEHLWSSNDAIVPSGTFLHASGSTDVKKWWFLIDCCCRSFRIRKTSTFDDWYSLSGRWALPMTYLSSTDHPLIVTCIYYWLQVDTSKSLECSPSHRKEPAMVKPFLHEAWL